MGKRIADLVNVRFGNLIALSIVGTTSGGTKIWNCLCDCGNYKKVNSNNLLNGSTNSCGCLKSKLLIEKNRKYNRYDLSGEYGIGYTNNNEPFYFDLEDYDKIKEYCWSCDPHGYIRAGKNNKQIRMSRFILNISGIETVDHINGVVVDNRKTNLRSCSAMNNSWNRKENSNISGKNGVFLDKRDGRYYPRITCDHRIIHLGGFDKIEDAIQARIDAEIKYFGEFRRNQC